MAIELISLTSKGESYASSRRRVTDDPMTNACYDVIYFLGRKGGRATDDAITFSCFGGDRYQSGKVIGYLKNKGIVVAE